jgi:RAB protein geranylgeranyltransferase component A
MQKYNKQEQYKNASNKNNTEILVTGKIQQYLLLKTIQHYLLQRTIQKITATRNNAKIQQTGTMQTY